MKEFFRRLFLSKGLAAEIVAASFFINILYLASPIFVIQILSRYIGHGFDGTLYTLTTGMVFALALGMGFGVVRTRMCAAVSHGPDLSLRRMALEGLALTRASAMNRMPTPRVQEILAGVKTVQGAYDAPGIAAVMDMPFFILFVLAIFVLSPTLAVVTLLAVAATILAGKLNMDRARRLDRVMREESLHHQGSVHSAMVGVETVRAFSAGRFLFPLWEGQLGRLATVKDRMVSQRSWSLAVIQTLGALLRVAIYAVGAKLVVSGDLGVGSLIGVSILSAKALQIASGFMQAALRMGMADDAMGAILKFLSLPRESDGGKAVKVYSGRLELRDVTMAFPGASGPLFESLSCELEPGGVVGVLGANGTGKTSLVRLIVGLLEPSRGQIMVDGVDLRQLSMPWWRSRVMYMPQEPAFLSGTFRDNITLADPGMDDERLNGIVRQADLRRFLDGTASGLDTRLEDGGRNLPVGIRKRLALARALATDGRLALFDEPTEGLDAEGRGAVLRVLGDLKQRGVSMVVVSRDPGVARSYDFVMDLNSKPVPRIGHVRRGPGVSGVGRAVNS